MRTFHPLRSGRAAPPPDRIITFDTETRPATCVTDQSVTPCPACHRLATGTHTPDDEVATLTLGHARTWTGARLDYTDASVFWDWLCLAVGAAGGPVWVVNHNIAFDLMVLGWDAALTTRGWRPKKIILPDPSGPFAVTWVRGPSVLHLVNLANWWGIRTLASIGAVVGTYKGGVDPTAPRYRHCVPGDPAWGELRAYCERDCDVVYDAVRMWCQFITDHDLGPFRATQAGQALSAFTHRFLRHDVMIHTNRAALELERAAYVGGRTEAFRIGTFQGEFHVLDVNSLYPYVMSCNDFPVALVGRLTRESAPTVHELDDLARGHTVIARVAVAIGQQDPRYVPTVREGRLLYPTGRFRATLCTPELIMALDAGYVVDVDEVCVYRAEPIFASYVDELYALRLRYKDAGNVVWFEMVKVFLNSLYGKFGQYNYNWQLEDVNAPSGIHSFVDIDSGERRVIRSLGGNSHARSQTRHEAWDSYPAIAAHVTAYARSHISRLASLTTDLYYCDTDSLFVGPRGMADLAGHVDRNALGALKHEYTSDYLMIRGLKDYSIGTKRKLKGIRRNAVQLDDGAFRQVQFRGIAGAMRAGEPDIARVGSIVKKPTGIYHKGTVKDTYVIPVHLEEF